MLKKTTVIFSILAIVSAAPLFSPDFCAPVAAGFKDITSRSIHAETGTIAFRVKLLKDISADPHNHVLLLGVSSDRSENYSIEIIQDQLIARRFFGRCLLTAFKSPYNFKTGDWHDLKLTWNKASTKFYIDGREVEKKGPLSTDDIYKMVPGIRLGRENNFQIDNLETSDSSAIPAVPADLEFAKNVVCPNISELINERTQEEYRGIALKHFPDPESREIIKSYLALLPENFAKAIRHVIYVEEERFSKRGSGGEADPESRSLILNGKYFSDPTVFFHEAAHLYDYQLHINFGVPDEKSEWAAISGASCYYKGVKVEEFSKDFAKIKDKNAFLGVQGGQCPSEDLAIWTAAVYDHYLKNKTFADRLNPSGAQYNEKSGKKLDFLLKKGFIGREVYDKISRRSGTSAGKNF